MNDKIRGHGKAGEEAYHSRLGVAYGSGGACGVRQNLLIRLPHVSNGRNTAQWIWRGVAGCWPTCGYRFRPERRLGPGWHAQHNDESATSFRGPEPKG